MSDPGTRVDGESVETETDRVWSPAQIVAAVIGLGFVVLGGVTLLRVGLSDLFATSLVGWYEHTAMLGILEVVIGLLFLAAAPSATGVRPSSVTLGFVLIALALISLIEPEGMSRFVGDARGVGWTYLVTGLVAALAGLVSPLVATRRHRRYDAA